MNAIKKILAISVIAIITIPLFTNCNDKDQEVNLNQKKDAIDINLPDGTYCYNINNTKFTLVIKDKMILNLKNETTNKAIDSHNIMWQTFPYNKDGEEQAFEYMDKNGIDSYPCVEMSTVEDNETGKDYWCVSYSNVEPCWYN